MCYRTAVYFPVMDCRRARVQGGSEALVGNTPVVVYCCADGITASTTSISYLCTTLSSENGR